MNTAIFPIVTFNPITKKWKCLGTGFFINPVGAFASAKHLFIDSDGKVEQTLFGVQNVNNKEYHLRPVTNLVIHNKADLMIGTLGKRRLPLKNVQPELTKYFVLDFEKLNNGDEVNTYAFPNTISDEFNDELNSIEFTFTGVYSKGNVIDFHEEGSPVVRNRCYQTNMHFESGASGGPVFRKGHIVGVNSSAMTLLEGEEPISFITPIDYILDLNVKEKDKIISVNELISGGFIKTKDNSA